MSILYLKSLLSLLLALLALTGMYTMFEFFGRREKKFSAAALRRIHRWNGYLFLVLFLVISYLCLDILVSTRMEMGSRTMFHVVFALAVLFLLLTKISYIRVYRQFYPQVKMIGLIIGLLAIGLTAISGGYFLLITGFVNDRVSGHNGHTFEKSPLKTETPALSQQEQAGVERGRALYREQCIYCHDPESREQRMGPGHRNILQREKLPVSGRPATPENIVRQLRNPYQQMPAYPDLTEQEIEDLMAYLRTL